MGCTCYCANKSTYNSDGSTSALIYDYTITNNNDAACTDTENPGAWSEVPDTENPGEATAEDYQNALREMGVEV